MDDGMMDGFILPMQDASDEAMLCVLGCRRRVADADAMGADE